MGLYIRNVTSPVDRSEIKAVIWEGPWARVTMMPGCRLTGIDPPPPPPTDYHMGYSPASRQPVQTLNEPVAVWVELMSLCPLPRQTDRRQIEDMSKWR